MTDVEVAPTEKPFGSSEIRSPKDRVARRWQLELWVGGLILLLDQAVKAIVVSKLSLHESIVVIPGFLDITHVRNTGAAFGFLNAADFQFKSIVLIGIATAALIAIGAYAAQLAPEEKLARWGLALILGGAVGNLIDRARMGYVVDFVDAYWHTWHFWAFNVADAAITVGAILMVLDVMGLGRHVSSTV